MDINCTTLRLKGVVVVVVRTCLFLVLLKGQLYINCSPEVQISAETLSWSSTMMRPVEAKFSELKITN